mmetsp:Transcript_35954/g.42017  ORF Transcript_35954/g.42017 Transcript_35954/m.42017 type:complete len:243 (+) Transcript_35954:49-777(+)
MSTQPPPAKRCRTDDAVEVVDVSKCEALLERLWKADSMAMFHFPVDAKEVPQYYSVITEPIDLSTIRSRLRSGHYSTSLQVVQDVRLMFQNALEFNQKGDPWYAHAKKLSKGLSSLLHKVRLDACIEDDDDDDVFVPAANGDADEDKERGLAKAERKVKEDVPLLLKTLEEEQEIPLEELYAKYKRGTALQGGGDGTTASNSSGSSSSDSTSSEDDDDEEEDEELSSSGSSDSSDDSSEYDT